MNIENLKLGNWVQIKNRVSQLNLFANYVMITEIADTKIKAIFLAGVYVDAIRSWNINEIESIRI